MLNKYLESRSWIARNPSKMDKEIFDRFDELLVEFDAWVATLEPDDRDAVESHIKAFELVMRVFPEAKINKERRNEVAFPRYSDKISTEQLTENGREKYEEILGQG